MSGRQEAAMVNLTPLDIQQQKFRTRFRGFDMQEVDVFLDQIDRKSTRLNSSH